MAVYRFFRVWDSLKLQHRRDSSASVGHVLLCGPKSLAIDSPSFVNLSIRPLGLSLLSGRRFAKIEKVRAEKSGRIPKVVGVFDEVPAFRSES